MGKLASPEQLRLPVAGRSGLPFVIRARYLRRATKNRLAKLAAASTVLGTAGGFMLRALAEDQARLEQLRERSRILGRRSSVRVAAFAVTISGRRVHRLMEELSVRISTAEKQLLCG